MITLCTCIAAIARFAAVTSSLATGRFAGGTEPLSNVRYVRWFGEHMLTASFTAHDPERSSEALASTCLRQCSLEVDDTPAATCSQSRTTKFTNRPGTAISFTIVLPASSSFTCRSDFTSDISASAGMSASATILCRSRPFSWMIYSR